MAKWLIGCKIQMVEKSLIFCLSSVFVEGCGKKNEQPVIIHTFQYDKLRRQDSTVLTIREWNGIKELFFSMAELPDKSFTTRDPIVKIFSNLDTIIIYKDLPIYLTDSKMYQDRGRQRKVNKYFYDEEGVKDEEVNVYVLDDGRLLGTKSVIWNQYMIYDYPDTVVDSLLQADNSVFFYKWRKDK